MIYQTPNVITTLRLLLVFPISVSIYQDNTFLALILFILAGLSDWLDGFLARKFNWESKFGQLLDPLADKLLILSTLLAMAFSNLLPIWFVSVLLTRDAIIAMGAMAYMMIFEGQNALSNRWGKHNTGWIISLFILVLLDGQLDLEGKFLFLLIQIAKLGVLVFSFISLFFYLKDPGKSIFKHLIDY